ncbi:MAG: response regulator [Leptolyngbyaceae cyanobacterium bins.59]|nr:response regulator [Leptolyngbyaceae cyanobacterium bins.59]
MNDYSMMDLFRKEVAHQVGVLIEKLSLLRYQPSTDKLEALVQASHAIWGAARMMEVEAIVGLGQVLEEYFTHLLTHQVRPSDDQADLIFHAADLLLSISSVAGQDVDQWQAEHVWDIHRTERAIAVLSEGSSSLPPLPSPSTIVPSASPQFQSPIQPPPDSLEAEAPPIAKGFDNFPLLEKMETPMASQPDSDAVSSESSLPEPLLADPVGIPNLADSSMMDLFRLEVEAQTTILNNGLLALESQPQSAPELEALMRAAHSIKGAARIVALDAAVNLAHVMEDCFVAAQNHAILLDANRVDVLFRGVDLLQHLSQVPESDLGQWLTDWAADLESTRRTIEALLNPSTESVAQFPSSSSQSPAPLISSETENFASLQVVNPEQVPSQFANSRQSSNPSLQSSTEMAPADSHQDRVVRVSAENLNRIMGLAGESLVEANWLQPFADSLMLLKNRQMELARMLEKLQTALVSHTVTPDELQLVETARRKEQECRAVLGDRLNELELYARRTANLSDRLYREVITSHMRPFSDGVQGFPRMIRDLARKLNKQVKLEISGKATPVDRDILKKLEAPLTHILRNAVDHGIEMPDERVAAGKPPEGTIRLEAFHRGGMLAISITDDGRGLNLEQLRQKIVAKNLTTPEVATKLTDGELMEFIFLPGFSTAKQVTEISGRGVGLDIAKSMAQDVGGTVRAVSQAGKGIGFHFQLPLTLSVVRTLLVEIAGEPYAFPLARIDQIVMVEKAKVSVVENREYFTMDSKNIGLIAAYQVLELPEPTASRGDALSVVVISDQAHCYGLVVDRFMGERDLVVRPLDPRLGKVQDISAAALMGDGSPILIVDISDMVRSIDNLLNTGHLSKVLLERESLTEQRKRVLVVDDSITVREMERKLLQNRGYQVDVAVDGIEGWNALRSNHYDLVVSDVDMPRMNGIELVRQIRTHPRLNTLPIIIMSYRDREDDRIQGLEAGADYYLTKSSFHDDTLVNAVMDLIGR